MKEARLMQGNAACIAIEVYPRRTPATVAKRVPPATIEKNMEALRIGYEAV